MFILTNAIVYVLDTFVNVSHRIWRRTIAKAHITRRLSALQLVLCVHYLYAFADIINHSYGMFLPWRH